MVVEFIVGQFWTGSRHFSLLRGRWKLYGANLVRWKYIFSMENEMFISRFQDEKTMDEVIGSKMWYIANKPMIL